MHFDFGSDAIKFMLFVTFSYGLKTLPMPDNKWAKWALGVLQFTFANSEIGKKNFRQAEIQDEASIVKAEAPADAKIDAQAEKDAAKP